MQTSRDQTSAVSRYIHYVRQLPELSREEEADLARMKEMQTPGLPIHRESRLKADIKDDGMITVVLTRGKADDFIKAFLGTRRLFTRK